MAQIQIDLSASKGLYSQVDGANYRASDNNNLIYTAQNGQVVSGVYNPFRMPGYIAPAVDAWIDSSWAIYTPSNNLSISDNSHISFFHIDNINYRGAVDGNGIINLGSQYVVGTRSFCESLLPLIITRPETSQTNAIQALTGDQLNGNNYLYYISNSRVQNQNTQTNTTYLTRNDWQSDIAINETGTSTLTDPTRAGFVHGKNNILYVYDRNHIHGINGSISGGSSGIFYGKLISFPNYYFIKGGSEFRGKIYLTYQLYNNDDTRDNSSDDIANYKCGVFIWNKKSITGSEQDSVTIDGVKDLRHIWNDGVSLYLLSLSSSGKSQIRIFEGNSFNVMFEFGEEIRKDNKVIREVVLGDNSITTTENGTIFVTNLGNIYCIEIGSKIVHKIGVVPEGVIPDDRKDIINVTTTSVDNGSRNSIDVNNSNGTMISAGEYINPTGTGMRRTTNGTSWDLVNLTSIYGNNGVAAVAYSPVLNRWVTVTFGGTTRCCYSNDDGVSWTAGTINNSQPWINVVWVGGTVNKFIALSSNSSTSSIAYSSDGITFTSVTTTNAYSFLTGSRNQVCYDTVNNIAVLCSTNGVVLTSSDGITWNVVHNFGHQIAGIQYAQNVNKFIALSFVDNTALISDDLTSWTTVLLPIWYRGNIKYIPEKNVTIIGSTEIDGGFLMTDNLVDFKKYSTTGTFQTMVWNSFIGNLYGIRYTGTSDNTNNLSFTNLNITSFLNSGEKHNNETTSALGYWNGEGFITDNTNAGLNPVVPALRLLHMVNNSIGKIGKFRAKSFFLHNLKHISTIDMNSNIDNAILGAYPYKEYLKFSKDIYPLEGNVLTGVTLLPKLGIVRNLTIYCNPVPNEEPALKDEIIGWIDVYLNQSKTPVQTKAVTRFIASKGYIDMELNRQNANAIQIGIRWNTEHKTGENDMLLSQAVLTYDPRYSSR